MNDITEIIRKELTIGSNVMDGEEFRATMIAIANVASSIVEKTLGPYGASTVIDNGTGTVYSTKDGLHTLENIRFNDPIYNALFRLLIQPSFKSSHTVGDGTTTATVVVNEFIEHLIPYLEETETSDKKLNQRDIMNAVKWVTDTIIERISKSDDLMKIDKNGDFADIYNVAMTSSNGDERLSHAIKKIYLETHNPDIYIDMNHHSNEAYSITKGYRFDCNPLNLMEMRNSDDNSFKRSETKSLCFFFDHNLTYQEHKLILEGISSYAIAKNSMAIVFAPGFDSILCDIIGTTIQSMRTQNKIPYIMLVQIPYASSLHRSVLQDLRHIATTQIFDYARVKCYRTLIAIKKGEKIENKLEDSLYGIDGYGYKDILDILDECAGTVNNISIHSGFAVIKDYDAVAQTDYFKNYVNEVKNAFENIKNKTSHYEVELSKEYLTAQMHYIRLLGTMGTVYVEGDSIQERRMRYDTAEDVVFACKSAYLNGVIHGTCFTTISELTKLHEELKIMYDATTLLPGSADWTKSVELYLRKEIAAMLSSAFAETAGKIFKNKFLEYSIPYNNLRFEDVDTKIFDDTYEYQGRIGVYDVIKTCSKNGFTFDLRTNTIVGKKHTVLNPVDNDIEIIRSIYSMITSILTSKQLISINRQYDKMTNRINVEKDKKEALREDYHIKADAVITTILDKMSKR